MIKLIPIPLIFLLAACSHQPTQQDRRPANTELSGSLEIVAEESPYAPRESLRPQARPANLDTSAGASVRGVDFNARPLYVPRGLADGCYSNYVSHNREYGPRAQNLIDRFKNMADGVRRPGEPSPEHFSRLFLDDSNEIARTCPKYNRMTPTERMHFWVWTFMLIASKESNCDDPEFRLLPNDVNGPSACAYQMPERENGSRPAWRGPGCDIDNDGRSPVNVSGRPLLRRNGRWVYGPRQTIRAEMGNPDTCAACAIEVLGKNLCGFHSGQGGRCTDPPLQGVSGSHMFWNEMKRSNRQIVSILRNYRGCR